jgi:hypothetical protein
MSRWLFALLPLLILTGCGPSVPKGVVVTGKFTKGGAPLSIPATSEATGNITVTMYSVTTAPDGSSSGGAGTVDSAGAFKIVAGGRGIPPGKYRITLAGDAGPGEDAFGNAYTGENYLKEVEVPADKMGGEFDLGTIDLDQVVPVKVAAPAATSP